MRNNRSIPSAAVIPELAYADVGVAARWLCDAFGFRERLRIANHRIQLTYGDGALVVMEARVARVDASARTHSMLLRVDDVDGVFARAVASGATVIHPVEDYPYGERQCAVSDPGGHRWTLSQTIADSDPSDWGGELVEAHATR